LTGLTSLYLRGGIFTSIRPSIFRITTLKTLAIDHYNLKLKVKDGDFDTLAALPRLERDMQSPMASCHCALEMMYDHSQ